MAHREVSRQDVAELAANPAWRTFIEEWTRRKEEQLKLLAYGAENVKTEEERGRLKEMDEVIHYFDKQVNR